MKQLTTIALAVVGILAIPVGATAATVIVDDDLTCSGSTEIDIQTAIGLAGAGGTVEVCDGTYVTNLTIPHSLILISRNGSALTKIEGPGTFQSVITVGTSVTDVRIGDVDKGFDVSSPNYTGIGDNALISVNPGASGITVQGNNLHDPRDATSPSCGVLLTAGIQMTAVGDVVIADNHIHDILNPIMCTFTSRARGIFVKGGGTGDVTVERNIVDGVDGNRPIGINITFLNGDLKIANNSITNLTDRNGVFGSNGIEISGVDTDAADDIFGNSIDGVSIAIWLQGASDVRATNNTYTNLIAGAFGSPSAFNLLINETSLNNFVCGNAEDALGISSIDVTNATGNTCPLCNAFAGNFNCAPPDEDGDGIDDDVDACLGSAGNESGFPSVKFGTNRNLNIDGVISQNRKSGLTASAYSIADTNGCTCEQILNACDAAGAGYGNGHYKFGCSNSVLEAWATGSGNSGIPHDGGGLRCD